MIIPEAIIFDNSVTSSNNLLILIISALPDSFKSSSQYFVSFALFKAISWNFLNSSLELEAVDSIKFAPMLVPLRVTWSAITHELLLLGKVSVNLIKSRLNLKHLSLMSLLNFEL